MPTLQWEIDEDLGFYMARADHATCTARYAESTGSWCVDVVVWDKSYSRHWFDQSLEYTLELAQNAAERMLEQLRQKYASEVFQGGPSTPVRSRFELIDEEDAPNRVTLPAPSAVQSIAVQSILESEDARILSELATAAEIAPGAVVLLRSGSPPMTVSERNGDTVRCVWFVGGAPMEHNFLVVTLELRRQEGFDTPNPYLDLFQHPGPLSPGLNDPND